MDRHAFPGSVAVLFFSQINVYVLGFFPSNYRALPIYSHADKPRQWGTAHVSPFNPLFVRIFSDLQGYGNFWLWHFSLHSPRI